MAIEEKELYKLIKSCKSGNRQSQDSLYKLYYGYAMGICLRYSKTYEEAVEIANDGFLKVFDKIQKYTPGYSFKGWVRRIMVNSSIDYYRQNSKHYGSFDISHAQNEAKNDTIISQLSEQEIIAAIQQLPPSYRLVFNLYVIEGYKHSEIAEIMNISTGSSKSSLSIARNKLRKILIDDSKELLKKEGNG